jgi:hypothetical protein
MMWMKGGPLRDTHPRSATNHRLKYWHAAGQRATAPIKMRKLQESRSLLRNADNRHAWLVAGRLEWPHEQSLVPSSLTFAPLCIWAY